MVYIHYRPIKLFSLYIYYFNIFNTNYIFLDFKIKKCTYFNNEFTKSNRNYKIKYVVKKIPKKRFFTSKFIYRILMIIITMGGEFRALLPKQNKRYYKIRSSDHYFHGVKQFLNEWIRFT